MSYFNWKDLCWIAAFGFAVGLTQTMGEDYYYYLTGLVDICRG